MKVQDFLRQELFKSSATSLAFGLLIVIILFYLNFFFVFVFYSIIVIFIIVLARGRTRQKIIVTSTSRTDFNASNVTCASMCVRDVPFYNDTNFLLSNCKVYNPFIHVSTIKGAGAAGREPSAGRVPALYVQYIRNYDNTRYLFLFSSAGRFDNETGN